MKAQSKKGTTVRKARHSLSNTKLKGTFGIPESSKFVIYNVNLSGILGGTRVAQVRGVVNTNDGTYVHLGDLISLLQDLRNAWEVFLPSLGSKAGYGLK